MASTGIDNRIIHPLTGLDEAWEGAMIKLFLAVVALAAVTVAGLSLFDDQIGKQNGDGRSNREEGC